MEGSEDVVPIPVAFDVNLSPKVIEGKNFRSEFHK